MHEEKSKLLFLYVIRLASVKFASEFNMSSSSASGNRSLVLPETVPAIRHNVSWTPFHRAERKTFCRVAIKH